MEKQGSKEFTGTSSESLNDALDKALSKAKPSSPKTIEVIETFLVNHQNDNNYQIKLKTKPCAEVD